jgi:predicted porin
VRKALICAAAISSIAGVAHADELSDLKTQSQQLQQQNQMLLSRITQLEQRQQKIEAQQAQPAPAMTEPTGPKLPADDGTLTWHGVTLYGTIDIGAQYESHGASLNNSYPPGLDDLIIGFKNAKGSYLGAAPNNMSTSSIGLKGKEDLGIGDWSGIFKLETGFNPLSGEIADGLRSEVEANGVPIQNQKTAWGDSTRAGQMFEGGAYAGISHPVYGTLTAGRQNTFTWDTALHYDPAYASNLSLLGYSGAPAGAGDTEDRLLDNTLKYTVGIGPVHGGVMYGFSESNGAGRAWQGNLGATYAGLSIDGVYSHITDAISAGPLTTNTTGALSSAQVAAMTLGGFSENNTLAATVSDNTAWEVAVEYDLGAPKLFAGYERISYANPSNPLSDKGFVDGLGVDDTIGGYNILTNNVAFPKDKILEIYWVGGRYAFTPDWELALGLYREEQNNYSNTKALAGCSNRDLSAQCSGAFNSVNLTTDYKLTKRLDLYAAIVWSDVEGGIGNGYLSTNEWSPTLGARFRF